MGNEQDLSKPVLGSGLWGICYDMSPSPKFTFLHEQPLQVHSLNYMGTLQRALIYFKNIIAISGCAEAILFYASFAVVNRPPTPPA